VQDSTLHHRAHRGIIVFIKRKTNAKKIDKLLNFESFGFTTVNIFVAI